MPTRPEEAEAVDVALQVLRSLIEKRPDVLTDRPGCKRRRRLDGGTTH